MYKIVRKYYSVEAFEEGINKERKNGYQILHSWRVVQGQQGDYYVAVFSSILDEFIPVKQ